MLRIVGGVLLLLMLSVTAASAAPPSPGGSVGRVCDAHSTTLKKLRRHVKAFGGPLKKFKRHVAAGLTETGARLLRGTRTHLDDDDAAIQNDGPLAGVDADEQLIPALHPVGVLHRALDRQPRSRAFSPRSPRGPPPHA
jgi:hypothetical protein